MTTAVQLAQSVAPGVSLGFKNRIINGGMTIDQRNAGASVTPTTSGYYTVDRFRLSISQASKFSIQQSSTAPAGFASSLAFTSLSAYTVGASEVFHLQQRVEGLNVSDFSWGTASAKTVTLSFQVYSSLTGTFGGSITNSAGNRYYIFSYTISSANTWTNVSVTIPGDTSGTWLTTNGIGLSVIWSIGTGSTYQGTPGSWGSTELYAPTGQVSVVGTNGATFYITGVQLEVGTTATPFEFRDYGRELIMCQRYFYKTCDPSIQVTSDNSNGNIVFTASSTVMYIFHPYKQVMRGTPTVTFYSVVTPGGNYWNNFSNNSTLTTTAEAIGYSGVRIKTETNIDGQRYGGQLTASAEL